MIPKIVHYIWFGGKPFPEKIQRCIDSWEKYLPEYRFMLWNESTFDVSTCSFTQQAYDNKKWAFVSDYVRIWALNKYGGWYLDTDVEILQSLNPFEEKRMVLGTDSLGHLTALMGSEVGHRFWKEILNYYESMNFVNEDGSQNMTPNNYLLEDVLKGYGYVLENTYQKLDEGICIYPDDFFHVANLELGKIHKTRNSYAIHWHTLLWTSDMSHFARFVRVKIFIPIFGKGFLDFYTRLRKIGRK